MRLGIACEQIPLAFEFRNVLDPSRSRKTGKRSATPLYQLSPHSSKLVAVSRSSPKHPRDSSSKLERSLDTCFHPSSALNTNITPQPEFVLAHAPEVYTSAREMCSDSDLFDEPLDSENAEGTFINLAPFALPSQRTDGVLGYYLGIWKLHCLPALNTTFKSMDTIGGQSPLTTASMVTLAASRISRKLPQRRLFTSSNSLGCFFRPDYGHEAFSSELYGSALRRMSCWSSERFDSNPMQAFAVLVLFCYVESSMGYFKGFYIHSQGIENLLKKSANRIFPQGAGLLAAWVEIKMQNWWRRAYFGVPDLFQGYSRSLLRPELQPIANTRGHHTATILWILCESQRLNTAALIACWARHGMSRQTRENTVSTFVHRTNSTLEQPSISSGIVAMMKIYSEKLEEWRTSVSLVEIEANSRGLKRFNLKSPEDDPIYFSSHKLAMNTAYYVVARVMHCAEPLQTFANTSMQNIDERYEEIEAWIFMLLRIAAGISWEDCVCLNAYTIGFTGLLLACALSSRRLETGLWIQNWLEKRLDQDGIEEGNFPVFQILDAMRLINRERENGLDVVALFQTVDDGGGKGKFGSYSSQLISSMLVYGRCRRTGKLASYHVSTGGLVAPK
jgi:hypothetical protein